VTWEWEGGDGDGHGDAKGNGEMEGGFSSGGKDEFNLCIDFCLWVLELTPYFFSLVKP
jgi:hypothetical protein